MNWYDWINPFYGFGKYLSLESKELWEPVVMGRFSESVTPGKYDPIPIDQPTPSWGEDFIGQHPELVNGLKIAGVISVAVLGIVLIAGRK